MALKDIKVEKLTDGNYRTWSFKMQAVLAAAELLDYIGEGAVALLAQDAQDRAAHVKQDRKALAAIQLHISDHLIPAVQDKLTARAAWTALVARYQTAGLAKELYLRRKFFTARMPDGASVVQHIDEIRVMADELGAIGSQIQDKDLVMTLLGSLPESYTGLIVALESRAEALTWEFVVGRLQHEERRQQDSSAGALRARDKKKHEVGATLAAETRACFNCDEVGHLSKDCPQPRQFSRRGERDDRKPRSGNFRPRGKRGG